MRSNAEVGTSRKDHHKKNPSALDGVQFGRATRDHPCAAGTIMPRFGMEVALSMRQPAAVIPGFSPAPH
jgi:hypothetical protein